MIRALWSMIVALLWVRKTTATRAAAKANAGWERAVKSLGLKPGQRESIETHVKHAIQSAKVDEQGDRASKLSMRAVNRTRTYNRAANFLPRWVWAYVPYAEIGALGVAVGWLAHNKPDVLSSGLHAAVATAGAAWSVVDGMQGRMLGWDITEWAALVAGGGLIGASSAGLWIVTRLPKQSPFTERHLEA